MAEWADKGYAYLYDGDFDNALICFRKGAEEQDAAACFGIVELYDNCKPKDPAEREKAVKEAAEMLAEAARLGHEKARQRYCNSCGHYFGGSWGGAAAGTRQAAD